MISPTVCEGLRSSSKAVMTNWLLHLRLSPFSCQTVLRDPTRVLRHLRRANPKPQLHSRLVNALWPVECLTPLVDRTPCVRLRRKFVLLWVVYGDPQPSIVLSIPRVPRESAAPHQVRVAPAAPHADKPGQLDRRRGQKTEGFRQCIAVENAGKRQHYPVRGKHKVLTSYTVMLKA